MPSSSQPYIYPVKRRRPAPDRRARQVHDAAKCVGMPAPVRAEVPLYTTPKLLHSRNARPSNGYIGQGFVQEHAATFGVGNPRTTGATGGERHIVTRRNVSNFRSLV